MLVSVLAWRGSPSCDACNDQAERVLAQKEQSWAARRSCYQQCGVENSDLRKGQGIMQCLIVCWLPIGQASCARCQCALMERRGGADVTDKSSGRLQTWRTSKTTPNCNLFPLMLPQHLPPISPQTLDLHNEQLPGELALALLGVSGIQIWGVQCRFPNHSWHRQHLQDPHRLCHGEGPDLETFKPPE